MQISGAIGQQRCAYSRENIELGYCSEILSNSMVAIFVHYRESTSRKFGNRRGKRILAELVYTTYKLYEYSEESTVSEKAQHFSRVFQTIIGESDDVEMYDYPNIEYIKESTDFEECDTQVSNN